MPLRSLPPEAHCGFCASESPAKETIFRGPTAWEARMEHVGRHLEAGRGQESAGYWVEDEVLKRWLIDEELVTGSEQTGWRLVGI